MNTVMQRWFEVKEAEAGEHGRVLACINEAREIVRTTCSQDIFVRSAGNVWFCFGDLSILIYQEYGSSGKWDFYTELRMDGVFVQRGRVCWSNGHWAISLRQAEYRLVQSRKITTGSIIAAWEKKQL